MFGEKGTIQEQLLAEIRETRRVLALLERSVKVGGTKDFEKISKQVKRSKVHPLIDSFFNGLDPSLKIIKIDKSNNFLPEDL